ncbi:MAG: hypothetical protein QJR02_10170 [Sinobacteraceae bacterium]|nr:hypothetical protein [Nevskiaceae bacterium]
MSNELLAKNFTATGAIGACLIVKANANGTISVAAAPTDPLLGVNAQVALNDGDRGDVIMSGIADVLYGATIAAGQLLTVNASGQAVPATRHTHTENTAASYTQNATTGPASPGMVIGVALVGGVAGDIGQVLIAPGYV